MKKQDSDAAIRALTLIGIVSQLSDASLTRRLEDGLSLAGFRVLNHFVVRNVEGKSPKSLANAFQVTKGAMTNTLQRLEALGYVRLEADPADGRGKIARITRAGRAARERGFAAVAPELSDMLAQVSGAEFAAALPFLEKLKNVLDAARD
jgi:DNA-binding MarR family transcriptional regulator